MKPKTYQARSWPISNCPQPPYPFHVEPRTAHRKAISSSRILIMPLGADWGRVPCFIKVRWDYIVLQHQLLRPSLSRHLPKNQPQKHSFKHSLPSNPPKHSHHHICWSVCCSLTLGFLGSGPIASRLSASVLSHFSHLFQSPAAHRQASRIPLF